ncbi:MAG: hypothetical protein HY275_18915 [Gemmatimonadetes bacterium]|nr:hypothetical protein [Gemmatimonadota bacterium]
MTVWHVDIMWGMVLLGIGLFTGCCVVFNPVLRGFRLMGLVLCYAVAAWMAYDLAWLTAVVTWSVFAVAGGAIAFAYELWARRHYAGTGRAARPLVLVQGFVLWPAMIPDAIEGILVDVGVLQPSGPGRTPAR